MSYFLKRGRTSMADDDSDGTDTTNVAVQDQDWTSSTICSLIPSGDPYRKPGNQCSDNGTQMTFDSSGNEVSLTAAKSSSSSTSTIGSIFSSIGGAIFGGANAAGQAAAYNAAIANQQAMPSWLPIVAIGGIGIVAVMLMSGPSASANPARRRRRRHRR